MEREEKEPTVAPGLDDALQKKASEEDKKKGNVTRVTRLSWDEVEGE
ncbi:MAG: hypothetical protein M0Z31_11200 [Clostridia bacterium]|nr:hypothetical protein [Clostridia bacterium]